MYRQKLLQPLFLVVLLALVLAPSSTLASPPGSITSSAGSIRINEVMFRPGTGGHEWVELKNASSAAINIDGYGITDEDGYWYEIPDALPNVPGGAFVVVIFDGAGSGSNDYNFSDNVATLHTPPGVVNIFEDGADQCALYTYGAGQFIYVYLPLVLKDYVSWNPPVIVPSPDFPASPVIAFVAWGAEPGSEANEAAAAGLWSEGWYVSLARGLGEESPDASLVPGESIGLLPGSQTAYPDDWTLFQTGEVTQGSENPFPVISWFYPSAGATIDGATFAVSWNPTHRATGYRFQMDDNSNFSSPVTNTTLTEPAYTPTSSVPEGTYYWRVKVSFASGESPWSPGVQIHSLTLPPSAAAFKTLGITWQLQHKDTNMLCLDGDAETGSEAWDAPHTRRGTHGNNYCVRASMSMMASYYGGRLSQDRISYEIFKGGEPEGDLGHNRGVSAPPDPTETNILSWALGVNVPVQAGKPTFQQIKTWIDANRPIMARIPGHMRVIDGYFEFTLGPIQWQFIHLLDPWDRAKWVNYADDNIAHVWVGPAGAGGAPNVRSDENVDGDGIADTRDDSDGDGICDFDERNRFSGGGRSLNPNDADSDDDLVPDKLDMREYLFTNAGAYSRRPADVDKDGHRKELDPDNDDDRDKGSMDGCEDGNHNGKFEPALGETDNFTSTDDLNLHILLSWPQLGSDVDVHLVRPGAAMWSSGDCYYANRIPDWGMPGVVCDDPRLDVDCITTCTVENIVLSKLENGTYSVKVHYFWDHGLGPATPKVTVWVQGVRYDFGPRTMTDDQVWNVCTIQWPSKAVTPGGLVTSLSIGEHSPRPEK